MNTDYEEKLITSDPSYIKWTQWIFTHLYNKGLAYKKFGTVNYCPSCQTVLANEQVLNNQCERCNSIIEMRDMNQWYFKITEYKDRLIQGLNGLDYPQSTKKAQLNWLENLNDWCVSRQRKWGCPIPIEGEIDTLDTFVDSSFYYLRYLTDSNDEFLPKDKYRPVDLYVGGREHACMHLVYARFIHYFLYDIGIVPQEEPFNKVIHQGVITYGGSKMSKSKGNVVNPDDYDPDELRLALMFIGPYVEGGDWDEGSIIGVRRFLNKMKVFLDKASGQGNSINLDKLKSDIDSMMLNFKFNTIVSSFMKFYNENKNKSIDLETKKEILELLCLFAPSFYLK